MRILLINSMTSPALVMQKILSKWTAFCYNLEHDDFRMCASRRERATLDAQVSALKAAGAARVFGETGSGGKSDHRELASALKSLGDGDTLLVMRLNRLARSTRDLLSILDAIAKAGAGFRSLAETWADTTTAHGPLMLTVVSGLAEFERNLLRTGEGRERAKERGQHMGRPAVLTSHQRREAMSALAAGTATQADLARQFSVSQSTISRLAEKAISAPPKPALDSETERAARSFMRHVTGRYSVREAMFTAAVRAIPTHPTATRI
jgi:DNA invertase Pin-like site-specific DNA recombinase